MNICVYWSFYFGCKYGCQFGREVWRHRLSTSVWGHGAHGFSPFMKIEFFKFRCRETGPRSTPPRTAGRGPPGARGPKFGRKGRRNPVANPGPNLGAAPDPGKPGCIPGPGKPETRMTTASQAPPARPTHERRPTPPHHTPAHPKIQAVVIHRNRAARRPGDPAPLVPSIGQVTSPKKGFIFLLLRFVFFVFFVVMEEGASLCEGPGAQASARTPRHSKPRSNCLRNLPQTPEPIRCFGEVGNTMHHIAQAAATRRLYVFFFWGFWGFFWVAELASRGRHM